MKRDDATLRFRRDDDTWAFSSSAYTARVTGTRVELSAPAATLASIRRTVPAAITLRTVAISRGLHSFRLAESVASEDDGSLKIAHDGATETLRPSADGIEQTWSFPNRPSGDGDLRVHIRVDGVTEADEHAGGITLASAGSSRFRYGSAVWIDADGKRNAVEGSYDRGSIVLSVPSRVVHESRYPAVLDPIIGPEVAASDPFYGPIMVSERPVVDCTQSMCLVAWSCVGFQFPRVGIYAVRVDTKGKLLDSKPFIIHDRPNGNPSIANDGTDFLVTWDHHDAPFDVRAARITGSGTLLDPDGFSLFGNGASVGYGATAAFGSGSYLVAFTTQEPNEAGVTMPVARSVRVTQAGTILDPGGIRLTNEATAIAADVSFDGANFFVVWDSYDGRHSVHGARVGTDGAVIDQQPIVLSTAVAFDNTYPSVAFDGTNYLVTWMGPNVSAPMIWGRRVSPLGALLETQEILLLEARDQSGPPALAFDGTNYMVYQDGAGGTRVSPQGVVLDSPPISIASPPKGWPAVAGTGAGFLAVTSDGGSLPMLEGTLIGTDGTVTPVPDSLYSIGLAEQSQPAIASDGNKAFVAWQELRGRERQVYGAIVDGNGPLSAPVRISRGSAVMSPSVLTASSDGTGYLAVWSDLTDDFYGDIHAARLDATGKFLDTPDLKLCADSGDQRNPSAAFDGKDYVVVWTNYGTPNSGARVAKDGTVRGGIALNPGAVDPRIACAPGSCFAVWSTGGIWGGRLGPNSDAVDAQPIFPTPYYQGAPAIAFDGTNYLVVWTEQMTPGAGDSDLYGVRLDVNGVLVDSTAISVSVSRDDATRPSVGFDRSDWWVTWNDWTGSRSEVHGARFRRDGTRLDLDDQLLAQSNGDTPVGARVGDGLVLAYARPFDLVDATWRVYLRSIGPDRIDGGTLRDGGTPADSGATDARQDASVESGARDVTVTPRDAASADHVITGHETETGAGDAIQGNADALPLRPSDASRSDSRSDETRAVGVSSSGCDCRIQARAPRERGTYMLGVSLLAMHALRRRRRRL